MKIHITGIFGTGTRYLASYYSKLGNVVTGTDISTNEKLKHSLTAKGVAILDSYEELTSPMDLYIHSAAVKKDSPEYIYVSKLARETVEVGEHTKSVIDRFLAGNLSAAEKEAVMASNLVPLASIDWDQRRYFAVTGTDGKTTTASMLHHILVSQGKKAALINTLGITYNNEEIATGLHTTTPTAQELHDILTSETLSDATDVVIEVTSHGLSMGRVAGAKFDVAIVTNITSDHLDYHSTWEEYFQAKASLLIHHLKPKGRVILNINDPAFSRLKSILSANRITFEDNGKIDIESIVLPDPISTKYNLENASLALIATNEANLEVLENFVSPAGRMEVLQESPVRVIVDFAHTANSLENVLNSLKQTTEGKLHLVFGCAGDRDKQKRSEMGRTAARYADNVYLVPEDPRTESLETINQEILSRVESEDINKFQQFNRESIESRRQGIVQALQDAKLGDTVVITGKGHENSLCFGTEEIPWNDLEETSKLLNRK